MAVIAPFRGLTYNPSRFGDLSTLVAPPYDVISQMEQEAYYNTHPFNVIRLILGKKKTGDSDWDNRYTRAAEDFRRWEAQGVLVRSEHPSIYLTSHAYDPGDGSPRRTRWGMILLVRIEEEGSGVILPHERTFSAHKDDRLKLMRACSAQFSQIFGLYEGEGLSLVDDCREVAQKSPPPLSFGYGDGSEHRIWALRNPALFRKISGGLSGRSIFIADGHHRYETSRNFRALMRARYGRRPENKSYEFVMMYLTNMAGEGLTILPSHRIIRRPLVAEPAELLERLREGFEIVERPLEGGKLSPLWPVVKERLGRLGLHNPAFVFYPSGADRCWFLSLRPGEKTRMGEDLHPSLKELDVLVLSRLVFQKAMGFRQDELDNETLFHFESSGPVAASLVESGACGMAFFLNPTRIEQVKEVARSGLVMPRKSTYFYPKILSGLVFNKIYPHEIIEVPRG